MRAVVAVDRQPVIVELPEPLPGPGELLVRVRATALNRADLLQVAGHYPPPPGAPDTLGLEAAGEVAAVGADVTTFAIGDRVMVLLAGGGYADYVLVPAVHAMPVPTHLSDVEAAAVPEAFLTAFTNLFDGGRLQPGETALVHAGASGVGLAAIQLAKAHGCRVAVTASAGKHDVCRDNGADLTVDYRTEDFAERVSAAFGGADVVLEMVGGDNLARNLAVLRPFGRLVIIGLMGGGVAPLDMGVVMRKRLSITGSTLRSRTLEDKADLIARFARDWLPRFADGTLRPVVHSTFALEDVAAAHAAMRANSNAGKIVVTL